MKISNSRSLPCVVFWILDGGRGSSEVFPETINSSIVIVLVVAPGLRALFKCDRFFTISRIIGVLL